MDLMDPNMDLGPIKTHNESKTVANGKKCTN